MSSNKRHTVKKRNSSPGLKAHLPTKKALLPPMKADIPSLRANAPEYIPEGYTKNDEKVTSMMANFLKMKMTEAVENAVAVDCEMVAVGPKSVLAHVAIVDFNGKQIYNKYVIPKEGIHAITSFRTPFSGITPHTLRGLNEKKHGFDVVQREVFAILNGKTIVGHALVNDFKALKYVPFTNTVWDTSLMPIYQKPGPGGKLQPRKLKEIAKEFAGNSIQKTDRHGHSPLEDARASMNLYRVAMGYPKMEYRNMGLA